MKKLFLKIISGAMALLLLVCLLPMPYGYYILIRYVALVVFAVLAFNYFKQDKSALGVTFAALALLFQPIAKIALGRTMWNIADIACAALLIGLLIYENKISRKE